MNEASEFFSKLDWSHPLTYLSILGALGSPVVIWKIGGWCVRFLYPYWLWLSHRGLVTDYYYEYREVAYKLPEENGGDYYYSRRERIVSNLKSLEGVLIQYRWTCEGTYREDIKPNSITLEDAPRIRGQITNRKRAVFEKPLRKRQKIEYIYEVFCTPLDGNQPEPLLGLASPRRVNELVLRVIFPPRKIPARIYYMTYNQDGVETSREQLDNHDPITGEVKKVIKRAKPTLIHRIEWDENPPTQ